MLKLEVLITRFFLVTTQGISYRNLSVYINFNNFIQCNTFLVLVERVLLHKLCRIKNLNINLIITVKNIKISRSAIITFKMLENCF